MGPWGIANKAARGQFPNVWGDAGTGFVDCWEGSKRRGGRGGASTGLGYFFTGFFLRFSLYGGRGGWGQGSGFGEKAGGGGTMPKGKTI